MNNIESMEKKNVNNSDAEQNELTSCDLMCQILKKLGCEPNACDNSLEVKYNEDYFEMSFWGPNVTIWHKVWANAHVDFPNWPAIREAVNAANAYYGPTIIWTEPDEEGRVGLASKYEIVLHPSFPQNESYVEAVMDYFSETKIHFTSEYQKLL